MGIFFNNNFRVFNELQRTAKDGTVEDLSTNEEEDAVDENPPVDDEETVDTPAATDTTDDEDIGADMPTDDDEGTEEAPPAEDPPVDDEDIGADMPTGDDEDTTDYNIPDEDDASMPQDTGEDEDLGADMPTDDEGDDVATADAGDDIGGEPPAEDEDLGADMPTGDDEGGEEGPPADNAGGDAPAAGGDEDLGADMPMGDDSDDASGDGGDSTTSADNQAQSNQPSSDTTNSAGVKTKEEIEAMERELFSNLTPEQMTVKHIELKTQFIDLYTTIGNIIDRVNKIPKTDFNIRTLEFIGSKLTELRVMVDFNLTKVYNTRSYIENVVIYQQCLVTLNTIDQMLQEIIPEKEEETN